MTLAAIRRTERRVAEQRQSQLDKVRDDGGHCRGRRSPGGTQKVQASFSLSCPPGDEHSHWRSIPRCTCPHLKASL